MKTILKRFSSIPALLSSPKKQQDRFWKMLKSHLENEGYSFGVFEKARVITLNMEMTENTSLQFDFRLFENHLQLYCHFISYEDPEDAGDVFILAQHFNNVIRYNGMIRVNSEEQICLLHFEVDFRPFLLGLSDIKDLIHRHYSILIDPRNGYIRLLHNREEPALIIADLLRDENDEEQEDKGENEA
jgi:hypothetical protein